MFIRFEVRLRSKRREKSKGWTVSAMLAAEVSNLIARAVLTLNLWKHEHTTHLMSEGRGLLLV